MVDFNALALHSHHITSLGLPRITTYKFILVAPLAGPRYLRSFAVREAEKSTNIPPIRQYQSRIENLHPHLRQHVRITRRASLHDGHHVCAYTRMARSLATGGDVLPLRLLVERVPAFQLLPRGILSRYRSDRRGIRVQGTGLLEAYYLGGPDTTAYPLASDDRFGVWPSAE